MNREHRLSPDKPYPSVGDVNFSKVVRNAVIDEPESEVTIAPAEQANLPDVSVMPNAALTTVENETFLTLGDPAEMTDDELADVVIEGVKKIKHYLPYIRTLKGRFDTGDRDSKNRLKTPIRDCSSWKEFCTMHLDRTPKTIREALADKKPAEIVSPATRVLSAEEQERPEKNAVVISAVQQRITRTRELNQLFRNAEVTRSSTPGCFNLTLRDLTDAEVQVIGGQYGRKE
jgi:hypothetical protein